jgi:hypothetical protein
MRRSNSFPKENTMESRCRYTRINGARCAMPALNGHELCYEHQERKRRAQRKPAPADPKASGPLVPLVYMDDHTSVLANLNTIAEAFAYGIIDHHQLSALNRLMQTCLKALHQREEHICSEIAHDPVCEVTYDEDGLALAVDPPPAPEAKRRRPRSSGVGLGNAVEISAGAAPQPTRTTPDPTACSNPEILADSRPDATGAAPPPTHYPPCFQPLTQQPAGKQPVIKHLPQRPKTSPLFSNTYLPPEDVLASFPTPIRKLFADLL